MFGRAKFAIPLTTIASLQDRHFPAVSSLYQHCDSLCTPFKGQTDLELRAQGSQHSEGPSYLFGAVNWSTY